jgi:hypothetical protein
VPVVYLWLDRVRLRFRRERAMALKPATV